MTRWRAPGHLKHTPLVEPDHAAVPAVEGGPVLRSGLSAFADRRGSRRPPTPFSNREQLCIRRLGDRAGHGTPERWRPSTAPPTRATTATAVTMTFLCTWTTTASWNNDPARQVGRPPVSARCIFNDTSSFEFPGSGPGGAGERGGVERGRWSGQGVGFSSGSERASRSEPTGPGQVAPSATCRSSRCRGPGAPASPASFPKIARPTVTRPATSAPAPPRRSTSPALASRLARGGA